MKIHRIFLIFPISASSAIKDTMWKRIFFDTFKNMGKEVVCLFYHDAQKQAKSKNVTKVSEYIYEYFLKEHSKKPFDIFFSYLHTGHVTCDLFSKIKQSTYTINYTTNFHQIDQYLPIIKSTDLSIYASKLAKEYFDNLNVSSYWMPFAADNNFLKPSYKTNGRVSFVGTPYGNRSYYLWRLLQNKIPIDIYGNGWNKKYKMKSILRSILCTKGIITNSDNVIDTAYRVQNDLILKRMNQKHFDSLNPGVSDETLRDIYSDSSAIINFPESRFGHNYLNPNVLLGANLRDFEVTASNTLLITQRSEEILEMFECGKEIVTFNNEFEMIDKCDFYLKNPNILQKISNAGYARTLSNHTWRHRFSDLFNYLETQVL
jgi:spore maturation protein CgeB